MFVPESGRRAPGSFLIHGHPVGGEHRARRGQLACATSPVAAGPQWFTRTVSFASAPPPAAGGAPGSAAGAPATGSEASTQGGVGGVVAAGAASSASCANGSRPPPGARTPARVVAAALE